MGAALGSADILLRAEDLPAVDVSPGGVTDETLRRFRLAAHEDVPPMTVDGIAGPMTWPALVSRMCSY